MLLGWGKKYVGKILKLHKWEGLLFQVKMMLESTMKIVIFKNSGHPNVYIENNIESLFGLILLYCNPLS